MPRRTTTPRSKKPKGPTPVEATVHDAKRTNIPTADGEAFVTPEVEAPITVRWPRDRTLDPQLVWKGKDAEPDVLEGDAPPLYIQEKIDPRVLVENLRRTARAGELEPELTLFESFDGLEGLDAVDYYRHDANWSNRMILGDSLNVMASLAERERLRGKVQMIYVDPPYGIKFGSNWQVSARKRDVKDGKWADASREVEQIKAFRDTWELGINSYLTYLRDRLLAARDLLTESGSCFVQIGDENVHLVRSLMDEVFGSENFVAQVAFRKTTSTTAGTLPGVFDLALWFARDHDRVKYRQLFLEKVPGSRGGTGYTGVWLADGENRRPTEAELAGAELPPGAQWFGTSALLAPGARANTSVPFTWNGQSFDPGPGRNWKTTLAGLKNLGIAGRLQGGARTLNYVRFLDDFPALPLTNYWEDTWAAGYGGDEKTYVVQTSTKVVERCMLMCTDPGDLVLDPTCGSGTTASVAEQWGRRWITVDTSRVALALARQRLMGARYPYYLLADSVDGRRKEEQLLGRQLPPVDAKNDIRHGFVYERVQHITLKSIANNPDIHEGMSRAEIDEAIRRHADFEVLYDKPYEDKAKVRVTGPFTVESLSPHRSLAFARGPEPDPNQTASEAAALTDASGGDFSQTILDNLAKAGIQNGRRAERIELATIEPYAGTYIQSIGIRAGAEAANSRSEVGTQGISTSAEAPGQPPRHDTDALGAGQPAAGDGDAVSVTRIGISLGPQYGTVGAAWVKEAAKEAIAADNIDLLCVLGFAFDPNVIGTTVEGAEVNVDLNADDFAHVEAERKLGRVPVLLVRMNADLVMGEDLKKTGAGNLFTVFGEPDIDLRVNGDEVTVELLGVDVYDPTTGEVRSHQTDQVALWMIDTDYDGESFFVRHAYFTGGQDPYKRLRTALKADIDPDAWATLYRTTSRPFPKPSTGRIAVKVINDYGDEVLQVFDV